MFKTHILPKILLPLAVNTMERKLKTLTVLEKIKRSHLYPKLYGSLARLEFNKCRGRLFATKHYFNHSTYIIYHLCYKIMKLISRHPGYLVVFFAP